MSSKKSNQLLIEIYMDQDKNFGVKYDKDIILQKENILYQKNRQILIKKKPIKNPILENYKFND